MIAIRIEHSKSGKGIFTHGLDVDPQIYKEGVDYLSNSISFFQRHNKFPSPMGDKKIKRYAAENEFCAFKSLEQLREWVTSKEIREFIKMGFKVLLLDLTDCIEGDFQIIYCKEDIVQVKDITNLFK